MNDSTGRQDAEQGPAQDPGHQQQAAAHAVRRTADGPAVHRPTARWCAPSGTPQQSGAQPTGPQYAGPQQAGATAHGTAVRRSPEAGS